MKKVIPVLLTAALVIAAVFLCGCGRNVKYYDYTGELGIIASVEIIEVTKVSSKESELEYEVLRTFDEPQWEEVLIDSAKIAHRVLYDPPRWREGPALKIVFSEPVDGSMYVLVTQNKMVYAKQREGWIELDSYFSACDREPWDEFMAKYLGVEKDLKETTSADE